MILDILILVLVAIAVFIGYKRGTVQPLFTFLGFGLTVLILLTHWQGYSTGLNTRFHSNGVIDGILIVVFAVLVAWGGWKLGGFVHKMPIVRGADGLLGVLICGLVAVWLLYGVISIGTSMGRAFDDTLGQTSATPTTPAQAQAINTWVEGNPVLRLLVDKRDLKNLEKAAATPNNGASSITSGNFSSIEQLQKAYASFIEPQLQESHLAPIVMWIGDHTPVIGHEGPSDLPTPPTPSPSTSPSPSPTP